MKKIIIILTLCVLNYANELDKNEFLSTQRYMCEDGDSEACGVIGAIYSMEEFAKEYGVSLDYFIANKYLKKACDGNDNSGCFNLAISYDLGQGVSKNSTKACELYKKACELNHANACYIVGGYLNSNENEALNYFIKACNLKEKNACNNAGAIFFNQDNTEKAIIYFNKACELGDDWGCKNANILD